MFPEREQVRQGTGWKGTDDPHSSSFITVHEGTTGREEVQAARDFRESEYGRAANSYGNLEELEIDGCTAWGWTELRVYRNKISSREIKVVVPYDTVTFAVEFYSNDPDWMASRIKKATVPDPRRGNMRLVEMPKADAALEGDPSGNPGARATHRETLGPSSELLVHRGLGYLVGIRQGYPDQEGLRESLGT